MTKRYAIEQVIELVQAGEVIAYPTEAVYGLGCDPLQQSAVLRLLAIKQRPVEKGLIIVAANYSQLLPYIDDKAIPLERRAEIISSWPGHMSWLLPASKTAPAWISGQHSSIAVRVSAHPVVRELCMRLNHPLVSTSANLAGQSPIVDADVLEANLGKELAAIVVGDLGGASQPSQIRDAMNGHMVRS